MSEKSKKQRQIAINQQYKKKRRKQSIFLPKPNVNNCKKNELMCNYYNTHPSYRKN